MNKEGNVFFVLISLALILYGVFGRSWYAIIGGAFLMVMAGLDSGGDQ